MSVANFRFWYAARVFNVVDGDTVDIEVDMGLRIYFRDRFRLAGINAYELRDPDPQKREMAGIARGYLIEKTLNRDVIIHTQKDLRDKYGRWLVTIYYRLDEYWININEELVQKGYAQQYSQ